MIRTISFAVLGLFCAAGWADDKADRAVDAVLSLEAREGIANRANQLAGVMDAPCARWATGYVNEADGWHPFDSAATRLDDDSNWQEYQRRRGTQSLTLQQHLELADWCAAHGLKDQQRAHLWGALVLNSKQPAVWQKLGFHEVNGEWLTSADEQSQKVKQKKTERDYRAWVARAQSLQQRLSDPSPGAQANAREQLMAIKNVAALPALEAMLAPTSQEVALDFVKWASGLQRVETTMALARQAVMSPWESVRETSIDALKERRLDHFVPALLDTLVMPTEMFAAADPSNVNGPVLVVQARRESRHQIVEGSYILVRLTSPYVLGVIQGRAAAEYLNSFMIPALLIRRSNDVQRAASAQSEELREMSYRADLAQGMWNDRVALILTAVSDSPTQTPKEWWTWWSEVSGFEPQEDSTKPVVNTTPQVQRIQQWIPIYIGHSCLPAGTPIITEAGPKRIETIRIGDRVLSKDIVTGELAYRPVLQTTLRKPQPLKMLHLENEIISATLGHYFWVSGQGWRMTKELKPGDRLHGVNGTVELTSVTTGEVAAVYNLVVERANTYFVGNSHILSHDVTPPSPTNIVVPGLAVR